MSVLEQGSGEPSGWLHERRWRVALWIAVVECIIVAVAHDVSRWTVLALAAISRGDDRRFRIWIGATALFGLTFISGQVYEFTNFYREGLKLGSGTFGSTFYVMTGLHGAHVTVGIFWLLSLYQRSLQGKLHQGHSEAVEVAGLYWHFVDIVWIVIFTAIYLVPYR